MNEEYMNWDDGLEPAEEKTYVTAPEGEYEFMITKFEKAVSKAGNNMAVLTISLVNDSSEEEYSLITDRITLSPKMQWKLCQFFECLGLMTHGEALGKMPWSKVLGAEGRAVIKHDEYNGVKRAVIDKYLPPVAKPKKKAKPAPAPVEDDELPFPV